MRIIVSLFGLILTVLGLATTVKDVLGGTWHSIGNVWADWALSSMLIAEPIVSRYIDPCGVIPALGCSPFLWHPVISTALQWYATPVFLGLGVFLLLLSRWLKTRKKRASRARTH